MVCLQIGLKKKTAAGAAAAAKEAEEHAKEAEKGSSNHVQRKLKTRNQNHKLDEVRAGFYLLQERGWEPYAPIVLDSPLSLCPGVRYDSNSSLQQCCLPALSCSKPRMCSVLVPFLHSAPLRNQYRAGA